MRSVLLGFCGLLLASRALAVDYDKIDRTILKEPAYKSGAPKYVLLLFGRQAKQVWAVIDGNTTYIDRNSDGDLTAENERIEVDNANWHNTLVKVADPDGRTNYVIWDLQPFEDKKSPSGWSVSIQVIIDGPVSYKEYSTADLWDSPTKATIQHFDGPLTIGPDTVNFKLAPWMKLQLGPPAELLAHVGTLDEKHGCRVLLDAVEGSKHDLRGYAPIADIEFPSKTPGQTPPRKRYLLDDCCCGCIFKGPIEAPPDAGPGTARVTFSFKMWKEGNVASSTVELPVLTAEQVRAEEEKERAAQEKAEAAKK